MMKVFSTQNEKKSAIITSLIGVLLIFIFFTFGLTFFDPPISYAVEVNFGTISDKKIDFKTSKTPSKKTIPNNNFNDSELNPKTVVQKKSIVSIDDKSSNPDSKKKSLDKNSTKEALDILKTLVPEWVRYNKKINNFEI